MASFSSFCRFFGEEARDLYFFKLGLNNVGSKDVTNVCGKRRSMRHVTWGRLLVGSQPGFNFEPAMEPRRYGVQYACGEGSLLDDAGFGSCRNIQGDIAKCWETIDNIGKWKHVKP